VTRLKALRSPIQGLSQRLQTINPESWRGGKTTAERGYGAKWQKARATYLASHPLCVMCEALGRAEVATVVDHVVPHRGDQKLFWDEGNWAALCAHHHSSDKAREEHAAGQR